MVAFSYLPRIGREGWVAVRNTPRKLVWRARIVLLSAPGAGVTAIVRARGKTKRTGYHWRARYVASGVAGLERDATRPGRKPPLDAAVIERVVTLTLHEKPPAATHWSARTLARRVELGHTSVQRISAARVEAASDEDVQAVERQAIRREDHRRSRPLP